MCVNKCMCECVGVSKCMCECESEVEYEKYPVV